MAGKTAFRVRGLARSAVLLAALYAAVTLGAAAPADATLAAYGLFESGFDEFSPNATSVRICWSGDEAESSDSWYVRRAAGTTPPPADARPEVVLPGGTQGVCYTARGLVTDEPYTFRITGHDESGESEPGFVTVAARNDGTFVRHGRRSEELPGGNETRFGDVQLAMTARGRRWHAIYLGSTPGARGLLYTARGKGGWTEPEQVAGPNTVPEQLASNAAGALALAWDPVLEVARYRLRLPGATRFGAVHTVPRAEADPTDGLQLHPDGLALDRHGRLHLLLEHEDAGLRYVANASGKWREQPIPNTSCHSLISSPCPRRPFIAYDAVTDRIVVVEQQRRVLRIATKRAPSKELGAFRPLAAANKRHLIATGLTTRGNRITLGLESNVGTFPSESAAGPLYVMTNGRLVRVPGTTANDWNLLVAASSPDRVQLAWQRRSTSWDRRQQGIWTAVSIRNKRTGRWRIRNIRHQTHSHYDRLTSLTVSATGRALIAYLR